MRSTNARLHSLTHIDIGNFYSYGTERGSPTPFCVCVTVFFRVTKTRAERLLRADQGVGACFTAVRCVIGATKGAMHDTHMPHVSGVTGVDFSLCT